MFLKDSARVKKLLLVLMGEIKNQSYSGKIIFSMCVFFFSPLSWPFALIVFCLFVFLFISHIGFKGGIWFLIACEQFLFIALMLKCEK